MRFTPKCGRRTTLTGFDDQCGRSTWNPFRRDSPKEEPEANLDPGDVIDVTDRIAADGSIDVLSDLPGLSR